MLRTSLQSASCPVSGVMQSKRGSPHESIPESVASAHPRTDSEVIAPQPSEQSTLSALPMDALTTTKPKQASFFPGKCRETHTSALEQQLIST